MADAGTEIEFGFYLESTSAKGRGNKIGQRQEWSRGAGLQGLGQPAALKRAPTPEYPVLGPNDRTLYPHLAWSLPAGCPGQGVTLTRRLPACADPERADIRPPADYIPEDWQQILPWREVWTSHLCSPQRWLRGKESDV